MSLPELLDRKVFELFERQITNEKWATTYLITGEELTKKRVLAVSFAKALNCARRPFQISCICDICTRIENGSHPDVKWYGLDEEANSIKIGEVRDFKNWLAFKPYEAKVKVF